MTYLLSTARNQDQRRVKERRRQGQKLTLAQQYLLIGSSTATCPCCAKEIDVSTYEHHITRCQIERQKEKASSVKQSKSRKAKKVSGRPLKDKLPRKKVRRARALIDRFAQRPSKGKRSRKKASIVQGGLPSLGKRK